MPATSLDLPLPQANEHTAALTQAQCRELMQQRQARTLLPGQVRDLLLARPSQPPSAEEMLLSGGLTVAETAQRLG